MRKPETKQRRAEETKSTGFAAPRRPSAGGEAAAVPALVPAPVHPVVS